MNSIDLKLTRNLRRQVLQGHPWVYKQALMQEKSLRVERPCLGRLKDQKGEFLAWGIYDPTSVLSFRCLSLNSQPPNEDFFIQQLKRAKKLRSPLIGSTTSAIRLVNGEGDGLPGLVCDLYANIAVLQCDGLGPSQFWDLDFIANWLLQSLEVNSVYFKPRKSTGLPQQTWGCEINDNVVATENGFNFSVDVINGQKTGFFIDQRDNRQYIQQISTDKTVANCFCYTGGFSVYAGAGGAKHVTSIDISEPALALASENWRINKLPEHAHSTECADVFEWMKNTKQKYDMVLIDPPSLTHSEKQKSQAVNKYIECFNLGARKVKPGGDLILSSCSSHISFDDFFDIITQSLSKARRKGQIIKVSGQGADHPFPHACHEMRYLKFVHLVLD